MSYPLRNNNNANKELLKLDSASHHSKDSDIIDTLEKTQYSIADLLLQNNSALVRDTKMAVEILRMTYHATTLLIDCLRNFYIKKQYQYFDPHVGDSACQIRAYAFVLLSKKKMAIMQQ